MADENKEQNRKKEMKENVIEIPSDITVKVNSNHVELEKNGTKKEVVYNPVYINVNFKDNNLVIAPNQDKKKHFSVSKTTRKLVENAIKGFDKDFVYKLAIVFSHFPITVKVDGENVIISNFLGEKRPRKTKVLPGCKIEVKGKDIVVKGNDKYNVAQTAGNLERTARVTNKDYRVFDDGIYITEKNTEE